MQIEYDAAKDALNRRRHGLPLAFAARVLGLAVDDVADDRFDYGEDRRAAFAWIDGKFYTCVYTLRGTAYRIISVRRANRREEQRYG
jgi:hypothetical protein